VDKMVVSNNVTAENFVKSCMSINAKYLESYPNQILYASIPCQGIIVRVKPISPFKVLAKLTLNNFKKVLKPRINQRSYHTNSQYPPYHFNNYSLLHLILLAYALYQWSSKAEIFLKLHEFIYGPVSKQPLLRIVSPLPLLKIVAPQPLLRISAPNTTLTIHSKPLIPIQAIIKN
jgi:hypothetical protein